MGKEGTRSLDQESEQILLGDERQVDGARLAS